MCEACEVCETCEVCEVCEVCEAWEGVRARWNLDGDRDMERRRERTEEIESTW